MFMPAPDVPPQHVRFVATLRQCHAKVSDCHAKDSQLVECSSCNGMWNTLGNILPRSHRGGLAYIIREPEMDSCCDQQPKVLAPEEPKCTAYRKAWCASLTKIGLCTPRLVRAIGADGTVTADNLKRCPQDQNPSERVALGAV